MQETRPRCPPSLDDISISIRRIAHCKRSLANYKIPRRIEFSQAELPKNGAGKIVKKTLRERFWAAQERAIA